MARAGKQGHQVGDRRRQEGDVFGVVFQNPRRNLHQILQAAGLLHGGNGRDHPHNDQDDIKGNLSRLQAKPKTQNEYPKPRHIRSRYCRASLQAR